MSTNEENQPVTEVSVIAETTWAAVEQQIRDGSSTAKIAETLGMTVPNARAAIVGRWPDLVFKKGRKGGVTFKV